MRLFLKSYEDTDWGNDSSARPGFASLEVSRRNIRQTRTLLILSSRRAREEGTARQTPGSTRHAACAAV